MAPSIDLLLTEQSLTIPNRQNNLLFMMKENVDGILEGNWGEVCFFYVDYHQPPTGCTFQFALQKEILIASES